MAATHLIKLITFSLIFHMICSSTPRSFVIDYENNRFLKDGQPFRYISGSLHYFRVPRVHWQDRLDKFKAAGLNAIQTYVEWSSHEPESEQYNFNDGLDILEFLRLVNQTGLLVILRPGPYICAERDFGGLPYWLLHEDPQMLLRSDDSNYLKFVDRWWRKLFDLLTPMLYINGGPIISIQVENEYGSYPACNLNYTEHLRDLLRSSLVGNDVLLFTTDGNSDHYLKCGKIPGVYATVDFGDSADVIASFQAQRDYEPHGPFVNSEYYTGWLDVWGQKHIQLNATNVAKTLDIMLAMNASVNMYMFHGGTNFAFSTGSNLNNDGVILPVPTSYDYDAPLSEAGDPSELYTAIRQVISKYTTSPPTPVPPPTPKRAYGKVLLTPVGSLFNMLDSLSYGPPLYIDFPISFEALGQAFGFALYSTLIDDGTSALLEIPGIRDRGYVFVDKEPANVIFSRMDKVYAQNITIGTNKLLSILVENQGRVNYGPAMTDFKGIVSNVTLGGKVLRGWTITPIPLNSSDIFESCSASENDIDQENVSYDSNSYIPTMFAGEFILPAGEETQDTFLDPTGWKKGVAFMNGFNLGRYWPVMGPQVTLYVPKDLLRPNPEVNKLLVFELESPPLSFETIAMTLTDIPNVNGPVRNSTIL